MIERFMAALAKALGWTNEPINTPPETPKQPQDASLPTKPIPMTPQEIIYTVAKESLGTHMTLDNSVDKAVGCAEAVSAVLKQSNVPGIPQKGIPGTYELFGFLKSSAHFEKVPSYEVGAVIISPTGTGNGKIRGHVGICAEHGILSNESQTGLFKEQWDLPSWTAYYHVYGGIPTSFFRFIG